MRIGIFSESYEPVSNGVAVSVRTLIDELRAMHHHVCVMAPHYPDYVDESPFVMRVPSILTPMNADYPVPYPWFPRLRKEINRLHLDVLHSQSPWFLGILALRIARQYGIPHISTYHTLYDQYAHYMTFLPTPATRGILEWWMPEFYNQCDSVIVPSEVAEDSLRSYGVTARINVIPTGVPLPRSDSLSENSKREVRERFEISNAVPLLLYVGRIAREKNIEIVVDAFAQTADEVPDARLLLVGGGPELDTWKQRVERLPCGDRVVFTGNLPRSELDTIYAAADLFVFGSTTETQGLVVSESRAAGTPAVVVRGGGASENVHNGEDGVIVEPDAESVADAIRALLRKPAALAEMRRACLRNAPRYTPEAMAATVEDVYIAAVDARSAPRELTPA